MIEINNRFECDHSAVEPFLTDGSGYVEGRCGACGEEGFVYRDPAYEAWKASDDAPRCGTFHPAYVPPAPRTMVEPADVQAQAAHPSRALPQLQPHREAVQLPASARGVRSVPGDAVIRRLLCWLGRHLSPPSEIRLKGGGRIQVVPIGHIYCRACGAILGRRR